MCRISFNTTLAERIKKFLLTKQINMSNGSKFLSGKDLADKAGLSAPIMHALLHGYKPQPAFKTIKAIADNFNISIAEVLGHQSKELEIYYTNLSISDAMSHIRTKVIEYIATTNINAAKLSISMGLSIDTLRYFVKPRIKNQEYKPKILSIYVIEKLSEHLNISIDRLIGRVIHPIAITHNKPIDRNTNYR